MSDRYSDITCGSTHVLPVFLFFKKVLTINYIINNKCNQCNN